MTKPKAKRALEPIFESLDQTPRASDQYLWCDFIELRCLTHPDRRFSRGDLLELLDDGQALSATTEAELDRDLPQAGDEDDADGDDDDAEIIDPTDAAKRDRLEAKVAGYFEHLTLRAQVFGDSYPFALEGNGQEMVLLDDDTPERSLYLQLLISSSLRFVPKTRRQELTDAFEDISADVFRGLMPDSWEVHPFGASKATRYTGHLFDRLSALSGDWRGEMRLKKRHYKRTDSGDGGLDLVAWHPLGDDERVGIPAAAAQCGCAAEEWPEKLLEPSPSKIPIDIEHPWAVYYFMPIDLYDHQEGRGDWQRRKNLSRVIVVDRLRIVRLSATFGYSDKFATVPSVVSEAKAWRSPGQAIAA